MFTWKTTTKTITDLKGFLTLFQELNKTFPFHQNIQLSFLLLWHRPLILTSQSLSRSMKTVRFPNDPSSVTIAIHFASAKFRKWPDDHCHRYINRSAGALHQDCLCARMHNPNRRPICINFFLCALFMCTCQPGKNIMHFNDRFLSKPGEIGAPRTSHDEIRRDYVWRALSSDAHSRREQKAEEKNM